jgi:DNA-binding transcriptional regulator GbsR (MarR family)
MLVPPEPGSSRLKPWESLVIDAVGNVIEFWGFKANHGRIWALLYLRGEPLSAAQIQEELALSKGAVSMVTRELEQWGVAHRVRVAGAGSWLFDAETNLKEMIGRVLSDREARFVSRIETDLAEAERLARASGDASRDQIEKITRMRALAHGISEALAAFLATARLDFTAMGDILTRSAKSLIRRART